MHRRDLRGHLGAAGDDQLFHAGLDLAGRKVQRRQAAAAEAVKRDAADGLVIAGVERSHAAHVATLLALFRAGAPDHVIDIARVDTVSLVNRLTHWSGPLLRIPLRARAPDTPAVAATGAHPAR